jgi:hypothetical protein
MITSSVYQRLILKRNLLPLFRVLSVLIIILFQVGARCTNHYKVFSTQHIEINPKGFVNFIDLNGVDRLIDFNSLIRNGKLIKLRTSHPLSSSNFSKTRPRGIPTRRPDFKNIYMPGRLVFFRKVSQTKLFGFHTQTHYLRSLESYSIRPPPFVV